MAPKANEPCVRGGLGIHKTQLAVGLTSIPPILNRPYVALHAISPTISCLFPGLVQWRTQCYSPTTQRLDLPFSHLFAISPVLDHYSFCQDHRMSGVSVDGAKRLCHMSSRCIKRLSPMLTPCGHRSERRSHGGALPQFGRATEAIQGESLDEQRSA